MTTEKAGELKREGRGRKASGCYTATIRCGPRTTAVLNAISDSANAHEFGARTTPADVIRALLVLKLREHCRVQGVPEEAWPIICSD